ncbi:MAG: glutathione S-transferase family protein [Alphaproteobacteria bacterium]|nr:glutathione S-transferase family protein [Alphaproteobacteria bacterium]
MKYTLIVGTKNWSSWSLRPYLALRHAGAVFEEVVVPLRADTTTPDILKYSPTGRVPALKIGDITIWDSLAICETLNDRHPQAHLWPDDAIARATARAYAAEMHSGFPDVRDQLSMDFVRRLPLPALRDATKAQVARILEAWETTLSGTKDGFLFGTFSIADCMYAPVVSRFTTYGVEVSPRVRAYMEKMMALPAMQDWGKASQAEVDAGLA